MLIVCLANFYLHKTQNTSVNMVRVITCSEPNTLEKQTDESKDNALKH